MFGQIFFELKIIKLKGNFGGSKIQSQPPKSQNILMIEIKL